MSVPACFFISLDLRLSAHANVCPATALAKKLKKRSKMEEAKWNVLPCLSFSLSLVAHITHYTYRITYTLCLHRQRLRHIHTPPRRRWLSSLCPFECTISKGYFARVALEASAETATQDAAEDAGDSPYDDANVAMSICVCIKIVVKWRT